MQTERRDELHAFIVRAKRATRVGDGLCVHEPHHHGGLIKS